MKIRPIAIYLPQFHPIAENDAWWGKGFTEWRNVVKARPKFKGHYQPHLPADLGFYDLRLPEVREEQARLAREHGIHGFCYYHYWFNGKRLLERPFEEVFQSGKPDFPFMLAWANENWNRAWSGDENDVMLAQDYNQEDHVAHINTLIPYFKDPRYIRVDGKPVFAIYKDDHIEDLEGMIRIFREEARKSGLELYLCRFDRRLGSRLDAPEVVGFDAAIEFQPLSRSFADYTRLQNRRFGRRLVNLGRKILDKAVRALRLSSVLQTGPARDIKHDLKDFVNFDISRPKDPYTVFPGVSPMWDNSSRRTQGSATIFTNSSPELLRHWVEKKVAGFEAPSPDENFLFINAWNEWAEGNHLEPCEKYHDQFLKAVSEGVEAGSRTR
jgi:hypothetical protein